MKGVGLQGSWEQVSVKLSPSQTIAEIAVSPPGREVGAFFDLDGTLVAGFTARAHAGHRIRRRQATLGEARARRKLQRYNNSAPPMTLGCK